ncbi:hypothetical protein KZ453_06185 [Glaesserella parasuis]|uniref:Zinc finger Ogr/Delta-type domain-containing protein n=1 Tax=Glaesserella parasuis HPS10 TaxID=1450514 RepID=A0A836MBE0_GLAPU|nr:hypothetical protein [Glaesserella parasuis]KDB46217.1 hypothetical protein HPS10_08290 [Glaesserella parasuis HPS10]MCT8534076.1 hypothetical protein [Glaesserella parasuis]MCT8536541.1 hypothetical protein [Glaesserella parasuis]MCT8540827.1 hypothetical protein [Glaesserella parasuis]MCT8542809.1 hypothetical protein [Glaesserella parasuis]
MANSNNYGKKGVMLSCPRCEHPLNIITSERPTLLTVKARIVCCNPRCEGFRSDFLGEMLNFSLATFRPAPEVASWTLSEVKVKRKDENQLELHIPEE